jgi:hypothetical protein
MQIKLKLRLLLFLKADLEIKSQTFLAKTP